MASAGPALGQHEDEIEDVERPDRLQHHRQRQRLRSPGSGDVEEALPDAGAVEIGRLVERGRDVLQPRQQDQRDEGHRFPDIRQQQQTQRREPASPAS